MNLKELGVLQCQMQLAVRGQVNYAPRIAGGIVRNLVTERPIKDLDIFIQCEDHVRLLNQRFNWLLTGCELPEEGDYAETAMANELGKDFKVWKGYNNDLQIDVILVHSVMEWITTRFPDNISKMWMGGAGQLVISEAANEDLRAMRIRYEGNRLRPKRLARLQELYPTWSFVDTDTATTPGPRKPIPKVCPEVWYTGQFNSEAAMEAMRALSKGGV